MKLRYVVAMTMALATANAFAEDGEALFKKSGCSNCHSVGKKIVGPAFKDVAAKYANDAGAQAKLEAKVRSGGAGSFGAMPMPPAAKSVSDADIKTLVAWVLKQK
ncbi:MAG: c-type cytochrome [Gallionella sp.]